MNHITEREQRIADLMSRVYASGGRFSVSPDGERLGVGGIEDAELVQDCIEEKTDIIDVLTRDPLEGTSIGWGVRSCFYLKMLAYIDSQVAGDEKKREVADKALFESNYMDALAKVTLNGSFTRHRTELLDLMQRVLDAVARGEFKRPKATALK